MASSEIKEVIWIDKSVFNNENQGYKKIMETKYGLFVREYDDAQEGIIKMMKLENKLENFII